MGQVLTNEITVIADNRETMNIDKLLESYGARVITRKLEVGDYILSDQVAVERKTMDDFLNSIKDGRLFGQLTELNRNFESPILILENRPWPIDC